MAGVLVRCVAVALFAASMGCTVFVSKETLYLRHAKDQATEEEVERQLGKPVFTASAPTGETLWVYQIFEPEPGCQDAWCTAGAWCDRYVLTFDRQRILRQWSHQSQRHGGELMPRYCIRDGFELS
jgi:hypothetical protein